jgi:DNA-binding beta-propeller fold protein YncE
MAYVVNKESNSVTPIDTVTDTAGSPITVCNQPVAITVTADASTAWVACQSGTIEPIALATGTVGTPLPVSPPAPTDLALTPDGSQLFVTSASTSSLIQIRLTASPVTSVTMHLPGVEPGTAIVSADGQTLDVFDTRPLQPFYQFPIGAGPITFVSPTSPGVGGNAGAADIPGTTHFAIADSYSASAPGFPDSRVSGYDQSGASLGSTVLPFFDFNSYAELQTIVVDGDGSEAWAVTNSVVYETTAGGYGQNAYALAPGTSGTTYAAAVTSDDRTLFLTSSADNTVTPITGGSSLSIGTAIPVGTDPVAIAVAPDQAPTASLKIVPGAPGTATTLDASGSTAPDGGIASYFWAFGDGATATTSGPTTTHLYTTPGPITASVTVTSAGGTSTARGFTGHVTVRNGGPSATASALVVQPLAGTPYIYSVSPPSAAGADTVTVNGSNFNSVTGVSFGTVPSPSFTVTSPTLLTASVPVGVDSGTVDVTVTNPDGTSPTNPNDSFTYLATSGTHQGTCVNTSCTIQTIVPVGQLSGSGSVPSDCTNCAISVGGGLLSTPNVTNAACTEQSTVPAGWAEFLQNQGPLSVSDGLIIGLTYNFWRANYDQPTSSSAQAAENAAALKMVQVCWDSGVPQVIGSARHGAAASAKVKTPKPVLKTCAKTKDVAPCVTASSLDGRQISIGMHLPSSGSTFWVVVPRTTITSVTAGPVSAGSSIKVKGKNLALANAASIGGVSAAITAQTSGSVTLTVPFGAVTGPVSLATPNGTVVSSGSVTIG